MQVLSSFHLLFFYSTWNKTASSYQTQSCAWSIHLAVSGMFLGGENEVSMTASVPVDQATDITQNWIPDISKQKMKLKTTAHLLPSPPSSVVNFLVATIKNWNYLLTLSCFLPPFVSFLLSFPTFYWLIKDWLCLD